MVSIITDTVCMVGCSFAIMHQHPSTHRLVRLVGNRENRLAVTRILKNLDSALNRLLEAEANIMHYWLIFCLFHIT